MMESLTLELSYQWAPFTWRGRHLCFTELRTVRLTRNDCSHWGAAVYKWEGLFTAGIHAGKTGVLIGETSNLRKRINEYGTGTQESGNKRWREEFLTKGDIHLYVLGFAQETLRGTDGTSVTLRIRDLASGNERLVLEQLLILRERTRADDSWVLLNP